MQGKAHERPKGRRDRGRRDGWHGEVAVRRQLLSHEQIHAAAAVVEGVGQRLVAALAELDDVLRHHVRVFRQDHGSREDGGVVGRHLVQVSHLGDGLERTGFARERGERAPFVVLTEGQEIEIDEFDLRGLAGGDGFLRQGAQFTRDGRRDLVALDEHRREQDRGLERSPAGAVDREKLTVGHQVARAKQSLHRRLARVREIMSECLSRGDRQEMADHTVRRIEFADGRGVHGGLEKRIRLAPSRDVGIGDLILPHQFGQGVRSGEVHRVRRVCEHPGDSGTAGIKFVTDNLAQRVRTSSGFGQHRHRQRLELGRNNPADRDDREAHNRRKQSDAG